MFELPCYPALACLVLSPVPDFLSFPRGGLQTPGVSSSSSGLQCFLFSPGHISSPFHVLCMASASLSGTGHASHCFCSRRGEGSHLPGSSLPACTGRHVGRCKIIGLVHSKLTVCETSSWEGNYGCLFLASKALFSLVEYLSS